MSQGLNVPAANRVIATLVQEIERASQGKDAWWERDQAVIAARKYLVDRDAPRCIERLSHLLEAVETPFDLPKLWN